MAIDVEIDRALAAVTATLNDEQLEHFDTGRVQEILAQALGTEHKLTVDDGGGIHDEAGARTVVIRRTDSGEWITERQNEGAERSDSAIPAASPKGAVRKLLTKLKLLGA